jgi:ATP-dependent Zn protease
MTPGDSAESFESSTHRVLRTLARKATGWSGADIERMVREARQKARREKRTITYEDVESRIAGEKPARSLLLRYRIAVHEAGHAVTRLYLGLGTISRITIDSAEGGGYTLGSMAQDEQTEELLTAVLVSTLAGRAAEEVIIGSITGSSGGTERSDLAMATHLARDMETILGLGKTRPLLYRKVKDGAAALAVDSELSACVAARLDSAYTAALNIVRAQKSALEFLAEALFKEETLEGPELETVLEDVVQRMIEVSGYRGAEKR